MPLTKDDLQVEAEGWLGLLKAHAAKISQMQIDAMNAEGDAKEKLLADVTKLQEQQTALMDRVKAVNEELRIKGGEVDTYDNRILLCKKHHKLVDDNESTYTVEVLNKMKNKNRH